MDQPDFEGARQYALERLERELSPGFAYHTLGHTRDEVASAAERLADLEGIRTEALLLLRTAAYYHDIGMVRRRSGHEEIGVQIAAVALPRYGYSPTQIRAISGMIMATKLPQSPHNLLEALLADADLDVLGRADFLERNQALRAELASFDEPVADEEWYSEQLLFLQTHRYWTAVARALRDDQKRRNYATLLRLIEECRA